MRSLRLNHQLCVLVFAICTLWTPMASATYRLTDLGLIPGTSASDSYGINIAGQVVGESFNINERAFLYNGSMLNLGNLGGFFAGSRGINASGRVVGYSQTGSGTVHAFLWYGGVMTDLGTLPGGTLSCANAINAIGQFAGWSSVPSSSSHAMRFSGAVMQDLGTLEGVTSLAYGMNDQGFVVGSSDTSNGATHPFLFKIFGLPLLDLGTLGGTNAGAYAINNHGVVVGYSETPSGDQHVFTWNGQMTDLGNLGGNYISAKGINNNGAFVGAGNLTLNGPAHGYVAYCRNRLVDLNTMLDASGAGYTIVDAYAINDNGQIAATATTPSGGLHAVLLTFNGTLSC